MLGSQKLGDAGARPPHWDWDPQKRASPHLYYRAKFGHSKSNCTRVITEICQKKIDPSRPTIHWNRHGSISHL